MEKDRFYLTYRECKKESVRGNPFEILGAESGGAKAEGPRREGGEREGRERTRKKRLREAGVRKRWRELESRVKALRAL